MNSFFILILVQSVDRSLINISNTYIFLYLVEEIFPDTFRKIDIFYSKQVNNSNSTQVVLRDIEFNLSGNFSCEVTTDATFSTGFDTQTMLVVRKC